MIGGVELADRFLDIARHPEFWPGVGAGVAALALGLVLAWRGGVRAAEAAPWLLVAAVLAVLAAVGLGRGAPIAVVVVAAASTLLGGGGAHASRGQRAAGWALALVAGGVAAERVAGDPVVWAAATLAAAALVRALPAFVRSSGYGGLTPALVLMTAGGAYACVPDTEQARVLVAAALPLALLSRPGPLRASTGVRGGGIAGVAAASGSAALAGLLAWVIATGGMGRPGAVAGAFAAAGVLALVPAVAAVRGETRLDALAPTWPAGLALVVAQGAFALLVSRTAGLQDGLGAGLGVAAPLLVLAALVLWPPGWFGATRQGRAA